MIELRTLGALALTGSDGHAIRSVLAQPKRAALLAYLAAATPRGFHRRDTLLALFWPESDQARARASLRKALHSLRRSLGKDVLLGNGDEEVGLDATRFWCDAPALEQAIREGRHGDAAALYRGEFLRGLFIADAPEFERWVETERRRLASASAAALEALAEECEVRGEPLGAAEWWRQRCALDPYSSRSALRLARALEAAGDRAGALQCARSHAELMREEFDAEPEPEIVDLMERLREPSDPGQLPDPCPGPEEASPEATAARDARGEGSPGPQAFSAPTRAPLAVRAPVFAALVALSGIGGYLIHPALADPLERSPVAFWADPARSVAVLPFDNLSADPQGRYFGDGLTEDILSRLAAIDGLRVVSRTSVLRYRGTTKSMREIAAELRAEHVLEGSIRRHGDRVRITAQLIDARWDRHLWAGTYDREVTDVLAVQSEIAAQVARALRDHLDAEE